MFLFDFIYSLVDGIIVDGGDDMNEKVRSINHEAATLRFALGGVGPIPREVGKNIFVRNGGDDRANFIQKQDFWRADAFK